MPLPMIYLMGVQYSILEANVFIRIIISNYVLFTYIDTVSIDRARIMTSMRRHYSCYMRKLTLLISIVVMSLTCI